MSRKGAINHWGNVKSLIGSSSQVLSFAEMGWFGFAGRKAKDGDGGSTPGDNISDVGGGAPNTTASLALASIQDVSDMEKPEEPFQAVVIETARSGSTWDNEADKEPVERAPTQPPGYLARLKTAVSDSFETAKKAPATLEEAIAVLRGERDVKPDFERATYTVSAALAGGCIHGWRQGASLAARYPRHQRSIVKFRSCAGKGVSFALFALIFEGSSAALEALRRKRDMWGGAVGGGLAGMAYGVAGGVASARRGLFYGVWLGGLFAIFRNHVASLREQARLAAEDTRLAEEEKEEMGKAALRRSIKGLENQLETWPADRDGAAEQEPSTPRH